jgi:hypothetical protein
MPSFRRAYRQEKKSSPSILEILDGSKSIYDRFQAPQNGSQPAIDGSEFAVRCRLHRTFVPLWEPSDLTPLPFH